MSWLANSDALLLLLATSVLGFTGGGRAHAMTTPGMEVARP